MIVDVDIKQEFIFLSDANKNSPWYLAWDYVVNTFA